MLVLTRKPDQSIIINGNIKIQVLRVRGNAVSIGIDAPRDVIIDREETSMRRQEGFRVNV
jgi:carbon storage regulator